MKFRLGAVIGLVVFLVLAGTGVSVAYWTAGASTSGTVTAADASAVCTPPGTGSVKLTNGGFEDPNITANPADAGRAYAQLASIPGWSVANDDVIEVWRAQLQNMGAGPAPEGAQVVELNGNHPGTLYQVLNTVPGQVLRWSLKHRGRFGDDTMSVSINAEGAALVKQDQFTTGTTAWSTHQGFYVVPAGQNQTRFSIKAESSTSELNQNNAASVGNLVDDVTFGTTSCLSATSTITNVTAGGTTYRVGDVVEYSTTITNAGGSHANSSVFTTTVPAGLLYQTDSVTINGVAKSDTGGNDEVSVVGSSAITARLGQGATAAAGGSIPPANSVVVRFRGTIQAAAAGGSLSYTSQTSYKDALAPDWTRTANSPTLSTQVAAANSSLVVTVTSATILNTGAATWVFHVANSGPAASTGTNVAVNSGALSGTITVQQNVSGTWVTCNTGCANIGGLANGAGVDIRVTGTASGANNTSFTVSVTATATNMTGSGFASRAVVLDTQAPTVPTGLTATRYSATQINLSWNTSTDNVTPGPFYRIYRNNLLIASTAANPVNGLTFNDTGLASGKPYWYTVEAIDAAGNVSTQRSTGKGAVTFSSTVNYRVSYPNGNTGMCLSAPNSTDATTDPQVQLQTALCTASAFWVFEAPTGNTTTIRFSTGEQRRWGLTSNSNDNFAAIRAIDANTTSWSATRSQWIVGVYWDAGPGTPYIELHNGYSNLCVDVNGAVTTAGVAVQQYACNSTAAQRFLLVAQ